MPVSEIAKAAKEVAVKEIAGAGQSIFPEFFKNMPEVTPPKLYSDINTMIADLGKSYGEIKEDKPLNSPNIKKWFEKGGSIQVWEAAGKKIWTYIDNIGREVSYINGEIVFPPEAKHPVIGDINIGKFTGDRLEDKRLYLEKLEKLYGLTEIPEGYVLHHDTRNGNMQLIKSDWHKEFTHAGGYSKFKED
jgi:hypothetical protein